MSEADTICDNLGFTLEEAEESHARVNEYVATLYLEEEVRTTLELPNGTQVHKHQLVSGPDGREYIALDLGSDTIGLTEVEQPVPVEGEAGLSDVAFIGHTPVTYGEFMMECEAQVAEDGQPVWAY